MVKFSDRPAGEQLSLIAAGVYSALPYGSEQIISEARAEACVILGSAEAEAAKIVQKARAEAGDILAKAGAKADEIKGSALERGYGEGYEKGLAEGGGLAEEELRRQKEEDKLALTRIIDEIRAARDRAVSELEPELIDLTFAMVKKIVNLAGENDDKIFESLITKALTQVKSEGRIIIKISNADYERYFAAGAVSFSLDSETVTATVIQDPALEPWGCVIDSGGSTINAGVDSQLKYLRLAFGEARDPS
jgi:flagellar assembly protein FliH